jgi:hypothetical protein
MILVLEVGTAALIIARGYCLVHVFSGQRQGIVHND